MFHWFQRNYVPHESVLTEEEQLKNTNVRPNIKVQEVIEETRTNPYYPLSGPPQNEKEKQMLQEMIREEHNNTMDSLIRRRKVEENDLTFLANLNCSDLMLEFRYCRMFGEFREKSCGCGEKKFALDDCVRFNKNAIRELGYFAAKTKEEKEKVLDNADAIYLKRMKARREEDMEMEREMTMK
ncbi:hypothetical protein HK099_003144 [Clydaea vesicula]|uniref:Uncharacterized protein n=1 Tax=Clydaea vesicula TaxID=447962 RepID=A0AAD5Y1I9_9FUNG|nr:hypothetical protein HK099_003144 [Clydaea vesicula]